MKKTLLILVTFVTLLAAGCKKEGPAVKDVDVKPLPAPETVELAPGIVWAVCNMGATAPYKMGDTYMWGELTPGKQYSSEYRFTSSEGWPDLLDYTNAETKPCLLPKDDIVTRTYGEGWRTPTKEDWSYMMVVCDWSIVKIDDMYCFKGVSRTNGKIIYFPHNEGEYEATDTYFYYWTSSNSTAEHAKGVYFLRTAGGNVVRNVSDAAKYLSFPVRPVKVVN